MIEVQGTAYAIGERNPVLRFGGVGVETDTGRRKTGDGRHAWNDLAYDPAPQPTRVQAINASLGSSTDFAALVQRMHTAIGRAQSPIRHESKAAEVAAADAIYADAIALVDEFVAHTRTALEQGRAMAAELAADLAEEERQAAEVAAAERLRQDIERRVAAGVQRREAERLAQIEHDVRAELAEAGRK
ncbi:MAG TPA: hypothetical protein VM345_17860 [Acidimicrobiales bacterium]|jgi:hypothetical protein|nr:hypothetical protein [Acidimicrobiales bacterium]